MSRGAVLHVPSDKGIKTLQRPLQHLYPLEVTSKPVEHSQEQSPTDAPSVDTAEKDSPDHAANTTESEDILPTLTKRSMMNIRLICHEEEGQSRCLWRLARINSLIHWQGWSCPRSSSSCSFRKGYQDTTATITTPLST